MKEHVKMLVKSHGPGFQPKIPWTIPMIVGELMWVLPERPASPGTQPPRSNPRHPLGAATGERPGPSRARCADSFSMGTCSHDILGWFGLIGSYGLRQLCLCLTLMELLGEHMLQHPKITRAIAEYDGILWYFSFSAEPIRPRLEDLVNRRKWSIFAQSKSGPMRIIFLLPSRSSSIAFDIFPPFRSSWFNDFPSYYFSTYPISVDDFQNETISKTSTAARRSLGEAPRPALEGNCTPKIHWFIHRCSGKPWF